MFSELKKEIASADRIDMLVSFVKWSGLRLIIDDLPAFCGTRRQAPRYYDNIHGRNRRESGGGASQSPNTKSVYLDTERTRLHAKAYMFYRETGFLPRRTLVLLTSQSGYVQRTGMEC